MPRPTSSQDDLRAVEALIWAGRTSAARKEIEKLRLVRIRRQDMRQFANLARRVGLPSVSVKLLEPIIRPEKPLATPATAEERAEYAIDLIQIGAVPEGLSLLGEVDSVKVPDSLLFQALGLVTQWSYAETIPLLERYVALEISSYQRLVGNANLAAALVYTGRRTEARELLGGLTSECRGLGAYRLLGSSLMLEAQIAMDEGHYDEGVEHLAEATRVSNDAGNLEGLLARKWKAVAGFLANPGEDTTRELELVRGEAMTRGHWETVRDCDYYLAITLKDELLLTHLYHGTPYESYRDRLSRAFPGNVTVPDHYVWLLTGEISGRVLDIGRAAEDGGVARLKNGQLLHQLLILLSADFYRPVRTVTLHSKLFPGEYFNPTSSLHRVHELVNRLRTWLKESGSPLTIEQRHGNYALRSSVPYGIRTSLKPTPRTALELELDQLRTQFGTDQFGTSEVAQALNISSRSASRLLSKARSQELLAQSGAGRGTRYRLAA